MLHTLRLSAKWVILWTATAIILPAAITVRSDFEGGSIGTVWQPAANHLVCAVKGEVDQDKRNRQASWFYFRIDGAAGQKMIVDLTELAGEYNYRQPSFGITADARPWISYDRRTWTALPDSAVEWDKSGPLLRLRFTPVASPVWVALVPPYTNQDLAGLLNEFRKNPNLKVAEIGKSAGGRPLYLLTVTNHGRPDANKKVLWLMARQHAWESGTSWVMDGALRFLLGDDSAAARLRDDFICKFFPMADPDGVARGGVRFNAHGYDVNRNWDITDPALMPEIAAMRAAVLDWIDGGRRIHLFLNLHNTSRDYLQGPLTAAGPDYRQMVERLDDRLAKNTNLSLKAPEDWPSGEPARGRFDACQGLYHDRAIPTLMLEMNTQKNPRIGRPFGIADFRQVGTQLLTAMAAVAAERRAAASKM